MKTRVISGVVISIIGIGAVIGIFTPIFEVFIAFLAVMASYEIMNVAGIKSKLILVPGMIFAALLPFYSVYNNSQLFDLLKLPTYSILGIYVILMMSLMLFKFKDIKFEQLAIALYATVFIPYAFSCALILRDTYMYELFYTKEDCVYLVLFAVLSCVLTDTFAYFVGVKFGKHKLCPSISPKKSVEGAVGGLVLSVALNIAIFAIAKHYFLEGISSTPISFPFVAVMSVILSVISMFGDLSASVLKRNFGVKDFGKIIPGHGGIMDRFDSFVFVLPLLSAAIKFVNM